MVTIKGGGELLLIGEYIRTAPVSPTIAPALLPIVEMVRPAMNHIGAKSVNLRFFASLKAF